MYDPGSDASDRSTRWTDYPRSALLNLHLWLIAGVLAATAWHAYSSPSIAISARPIELVLSVVAAAAIAVAVRGTWAGAREVGR